ncbi:MAG: GntR family transcriptional regulator [Flaviflexus sp.]|nr:GntR family transcriptional regulator [Flaviflexus sp.]
MTPSTSLSKSELVYRELRQRIISGRYTTGYRLVLDQIAREVGVSPVPVREAIRRLEAEGLVTFTRNVGAEVTSIDVDDYANTMFVLAYLEGAATALSAEKLTKEQLAEATDTNEQMRALTDSSNFDARLYTSLNGRFHQQLCQACPNERLNGLITREAERITVIRRTTFSFSQERSRKSVIEHDHLLNLIRSGAPFDDIDRAAREHKMFAMRDYVRRTQED